LPKIHKLGILTIGQLRKADPVFLARALGKRTAHFQALARGEDERDVIPARPDKSISREVTFDQDISSHRDLLSELQRQTESVCERLRARQLAARTIHIKIRDHRFRTASRSRSLAAPTASTSTVFKLASGLLNSWLQQNSNMPVRLLGIGLSGLEHADPQGSQMDSARQIALDATLDDIRHRFGNEKAMRALALGNKK